MPEKDSVQLSRRSLPPAPVMVRCAFGYMLENPVYPALLVNVRSDVYSDNVTGAENQQERLIQFRGWVIGFVDGEGCFSIGLVRQPDRAGRKGYRTGYQVSHEFVVTQGASSVHCLHELREFFGAGEVYVNRRYDNHRGHMYRYSVTRRRASSGSPPASTRLTLASPTSSRSCRR
jgi:hypothetical protein